MPVTTYQNPNGMDPRGSWEPQNFLAGWNYTDRLNDYNTTRDLSNTASRLTNEAQANTNNEFAANAPIRDIQRQATIQQVGNQMQLAPLQQQTAMSNAGVDANVAKGTEGARAAFGIFKEAQGLKSAKQQAVMQDNLAISKLVKGYATDPNSDPNIIWPMVLQQAKKMDIDTKDLEQIDPSKAVKFYSVLDDGHLKNMFDLLKQSETDKAHMARTEKEQTGANYRAGLAAEARKANGGKPTPASLEAEFYRIGGLDPDERSPSEQYMFDNYKQMVKDKAAAKADATGDAQIRVPAGQIKELEKMNNEKKWSKDYSEVKEYQGKHWGLKKGKAGTQQSDWEKLD